MQLFAQFIPTIDLAKAVMGSTTGTILTPRPIGLLSPRYSTVAHSASITIIGTNSYNRGGAYVGNANISFALNAGSLGSLVDNGNGTCQYTAPANGTGIAQINCTVTNSNGSKVTYGFVAYPKTTYDEMVGEIATLSASLSNHGWKMTMRVYGAGTDFELYKTVLLHVEDTWAGTTSTFGGYQYAEGVFVGVITDLVYFEDGSGESALAIEVSPTWWWLEQTKVGESNWGYTPAGGRFRISGFAPVDSIWHFVNEITNLSTMWNFTLWYDQNIVDNLIIEEADLGLIIEDVINRTLGIAYSDRYGALFAIPDPDVRADEWWGTPASTYTLTPTEVMSYSITKPSLGVRKLLLEAIDASQLGIWAVSENASAVTGKNEKMGGRLICDNALTLGSWAVQKRAQMNRPWMLEVEQPLNHVMDLCNFADCVFTAPSQAGVPTGSAQCWVNSITYRPDIPRGTWQGRTTYLPRTDGLGEAEAGAVSGWGGSGQHWTGGLWYTGSALIGSGIGGWRNTPTQGPSAWCHLFDFAQTAGGWTIYDVPDQTGLEGSYAAGVGFSAGEITGAQGVVDSLYITRLFPSRVVTQITLWDVMTSGHHNAWILAVNSGAAAQTLSAANGTVISGTFTLTWTGIVTPSKSPGVMIKSQRAMG